VKETEAEVLYLTTTGRRSGRPREIEIWFIEHGGRYYVIAEHLEESHFVQNLRADPEVRVRVGNRSFPARARVVDAGREAGLSETIRDLSERKYGWGDGLVVELSPNSLGSDPKLLASGSDPG
jgi:deazaflavin-dependent oxidoreductase (nitroreductase family)